MRRLCVLVFVVLVPSGLFAIVSPRRGGRLPDAYYQRRAADPGAFTLERAWIQKVKKIREAREAYLREISSRGLRPASPLPEVYRVVGTYNIPVILGNFSNTSRPYPNGDLQQELFDGPWSPGTVSDYYSEISYGALTLTGTVYDWVDVAYNDLYYAGTQNGLGSDAKVGEFIAEILDSLDASVDFGQYDNDGPDGVPNSGDDDGFVDYIIVVHSESGGECQGNDNIWSHSWVLSGWPNMGGQPYSTNDPAAGGGTIKIDDYTIQPALSCDNVSMIEIGVFCHESGHAFGLPDLYDIDGGSSGIGHWGLMGAGNWNQPSSPAHMCAWSKKEMGWLVPQEADWTGATFNIPQVETDAVCFKLPFSDDRFRLATECAIAGTRSLRCGLTSVQATARQWLGGGGYGNLWSETVVRDFLYSQATPCTLSYDYACETEASYDYAYAIIDIAGSETTLRTYDGIVSGSEVIDLTPYLSPYPPPVGYKIEFKFESDYAVSDEDGMGPTNCGAFIVDNVSLVGGGENYSTDFESNLQGWYLDPALNPPSEYWLVENREAVGFDAYLHAPGLLIWHVDDEVANSYLGNSGGGTTAFNQTVRGVVLEEADGNFDLLNGTSNRGDSGDPFPGSSNNRTFDSNSNPNSHDNTTRPTIIAVANISDAGSTMTATMTAGDPAPQAAAFSPDSVDNDLTSVAVLIDGFKMRHGATFHLYRSGESDINPTSVEWMAYQKLAGDLNVYGRRSGYWNLVVTNPDQQTDTLPNAVYLRLKVATELASASLIPRPGTVEVRFSLSSWDEGEQIVVSRSRSPRGPWHPLWSTSPRGENHFLDTDVEPGVTYYYRIAVSDGDRARELYRGSAVVPEASVILAQNHPNPFNPSTVIAFYLPHASPTRLAVYDVQGALVKLLADGVMERGWHELEWKGSDSRGRPVASGLYLYRLEAGGRVLTRKMVLLK